MEFIRFLLTVELSGTGNRAARSYIGSTKTGVWWTSVNSPYRLTGHGDGTFVGDVPYGVPVVLRGLVRPSRRAILLVGATAPLAACSLFDSDRPASPVPLPPHPDEIIRDEVIAAERELLMRYRAVAAAHPQLADQLAPFTERHERHVAALVATTPPATSDATAEPGSEPTVQGTPTPGPDTSTGPPVPADAEEAIRERREMESAAVQSRLDACLALRDGATARLVAGIAACEASHDQLLRQVRP